MPKVSQLSISETRTLTLQWVQCNGFNYNLAFIFAANTKMREAKSFFIKKLIKMLTSLFSFTSYHAFMPCGLHCMMYDDCSQNLGLTFTDVDSTVECVGICLIIFSWFSFECESYTYKY